MFCLLEHASKHTWQTRLVSARRKRQFFWSLQTRQFWTEGQAVMRQGAKLPKASACVRLIKIGQVLDIFHWMCLSVPVQNVSGGQSSVELILCVEFTTGFRLSRRYLVRPHNPRGQEADCLAFVCLTTWTDLHSCTETSRAAENGGRERERV